MLLPNLKDERGENKVKEYTPQSYKNQTFAVEFPDDAKDAYEGAGIHCRLRVAVDGNTTLVNVTPDAAGPWFICKFSMSGDIAIVTGEGHMFLAHGGSWSGGAHLDGAIALKPGAVVRFGAKGNWSYLHCNETGITSQKHDPRLATDESRWIEL